MKPTAALAAVASRLRFRLVVAGWPGAVGLALLLAGGIVQFLLVPQQQEATDAARSAAERQRQIHLAATAAGGRGTPGAVDSLARFRELLRPEGKAEEALEIIQRDAKAHGLLQAGTEYKWLRQPAARLAEIQITLPVKGAYAPLRSFLRNVLADVPGLALEQCDMQRDNVATAVAEARLRFTLFLRTGA
jgi:hypothetical protein